MKMHVEFTEKEWVLVQKWHGIACRKVSGSPVASEKDFLLALVEDYAYRYQYGLLPAPHSIFTSSVDE